MKSKLIFIVPSIALVGFLAIKPPAIGGETGQVIVTPDKTITPKAQPHLRDFDDDGRGPDHDDYEHDDEDDDHYERKGHERDHEDRDDHDDSDEDDDH